MTAPIIPPRDSSVAAVAASPISTSAKKDIIGHPAGHTTDMEVPQSRDGAANPIGWLAAKSTVAGRDLMGRRRGSPLASKPFPADLRVNPPVLMNEHELSLVTGLCPRSIRTYVKAGIIPRIKIGRRVLFRWPQVNAALAKLEAPKT